jgi:outer membrane protein assembly factor BamB
MRDAERQEAMLTPLLLAAGLMAASSAPGSTWPAYQFTSDHNAVFASPQWDVSWKADIGAQNNGGLAIVDGKLFVTSFDKNVRAFDATNGTLLWTHPLDDIVMSTPLVVSGLVFAGTGVGAGVSDDGMRFISGRAAGNDVFALDESSGKEAWKYHTVGQNMPTGVITRYGGKARLVFFNGDEHVRALDVQSGSLIWERLAPGNVSMSSLALYNGNVYGVAFASLTFLIKALSANDQVKLANRSWTWGVDPSDGQFLMTAPFGSGDGGVTVADGIAFLEDQHYESITWIDAAAPAWPGGPSRYPDFKHTTLSSEVDALDAKTGKLLWKYRGAPGLASNAGSNIQSIAGLYDSNSFYDSLPYSREFASFEAKMGRLQWKIATKGVVKMGAVEQGGDLFFGDNEGNFYVVRAADGVVLRTLAFSAPFGCSPPVIVGKTLFVTDGATLFAFRLSDLRSGTISTKSAS